MDNFDEEFYLALYPDVAEAVENGVFSSGEEHFQQFGQAEGRLGAPANVITFDDDEGVADRDYGNFDLIGTVGGISFSSNARALVDTDAQGEGNFGNNPSGDTTVAYADGDSITLTLVSGPVTGGILSFYYSSPNQSHEVVFLDSTGAELDRQPLEATTGQLNQFTDWQREIIPFEGNVSAIRLGSAAREIGFDDISFDVLGAQINRPPIARSDSASVTGSIPTTIPVLDNDSDLDGDELTVINFAVTTDNGGTISLADNGTPDDPTDDFLSYTPPDGFAGVDSFTYTVADDLGLTATATVSVTVNVGNGSISGTKFQDDNGNGVQEDDEAAISGVTIFLDADNNGELDSGEQSVVTDADGNYIFTDLEPGTYIVREVVPDRFSQTFPSGGSLVGDGFADVVLEFFDSGAGPLAGPYGSMGTGTREPEPVSLDVVLGDDSEVSDFLSLPTGSFVTVGFTDETVIDGPGNDIIIPGIDSAGEEAEVWVSSNLTDFTLLARVSQDVDTSLDLASIAFTEPVQAVRIIGLDNRGSFPGFELFNVQVSPQSLGSGNHVVTIDAGENVEDLDFGNVENQSPVAVDDAGVITDADTPVTIDVLSNDLDPDGNPISLISFGATTTNGGTVSRDNNNTPDDLTDDSLIYTAPEDFAGTDTITYTISDGLGGADIGNVNITVAGEGQPLDLAGEWQYSSPEDFTILSAGFSDGAPAFAAPLEIIQNGNQVTITGFYLNSTGSGTGVISGNNITATLPIAGGTGELDGTISPDGGTIEGTIVFSDGQSENSTATISFTMLSQGPPAGDDDINGDEEDNVLLANLGDDTISGLAGDDSLDGGVGDDQLLGEAGDDTLKGGDSGGRFDFSRTDFPAGDRPGDLAAADFDGDGDIDFTVANPGFDAAVAGNFDGNTVLLLLNDGDGALALSETLITGVGPSVTSGDLDNDGDIDIATANAEDDNISVLLNNGDGTFADRENFETGDRPFIGPAADLDGDGDIDLVTVNSEALNLNTGIDIGDTISVLRNDGDGSFDQPETLTVGDGVTDVTAAELDGDGDTDLVTANEGEDTILVLLNNGDGTFVESQRLTVGSRPRSVVAEDFDRDGNTDLAVANIGGDSVSVLRNNGNGTFAAAVAFPTEDVPSSLIAADLDSDGDIDLAMRHTAFRVGTGASRGNTFSVLENNGDGTFAAPEIFPVDNRPVSLVAVNLNDSGNLDIATSNFDGDNISVYLSTAVTSSGDDTLSGGAGADDFVFNNPNDGIDTILDFAVGVDRIVISVDGFGGGLKAIGSLPATLDPTQFTLGTAATNENDCFIYDTETGNLWFDADGDGPTPQIQILTLAGSPALSATDILLIGGNQRPVAVDDAAETSANTPVTIDVLSNDFDPDENPISLISFGATTTNGGTVSRDNNNTPGNLTDDSLIYTPPADFAGTDTITYTISDGLGGADVGNVNITVAGEGQPLDLTGEWQYSSPEDFTILSTGFSDGAPAFAAPLEIIQNGNQVTITGFYLNSTGSGTGVISGNNITATLPIAGGTGELVGTISDNGRTISGTIVFSDGEAENSTAIIDFTMFSQLDGGNDIINGDAGDNLLTADFGDDFIRGLAGDDQLDGGAGNDTLDSGASTITVETPDELDFSVAEFSVGDAPIDLVAVNLSINILGVQVEDLFIITANSGSNDLSLLQSNGDGSFTNLALPLAFPDGVTASSLRSADEDADGNADFLVGTNIENNTIVGVRTTLETFEFPVGDSPVSVALADFNGDGNIDGATANSGDDTVTILSNINNEDVTTDSLSVGTAPSYITAADIDGDEDQDLIVVSNGSNSISILRNDGAGNFQMISERAVGNSPVWVTAADLNGDDAIDLAVVNSEDDSISLSLNNGSGSFFSAGTIQVGSNPVSLTAADLDGDSDIDLAVINSDDNNVSVWRNDGNASFSASVTVAVGSNPASVTAADLDEDGDIDLAVANSDSDDVSVILNNGLVSVSDGGSDGEGDTVTGGAGNDSFILNGPEDGFDIITDFVPAEDSLLISQDVFGDEFTPETVDETQFTLSTAATTPDHRFIYDIDTGTLFFDADGNGGATQVQLAILTAGIEISAADILVVDSVTLPNRSPVATDDRATIAENTTGTIDVLTNDVDLDEDPISLTGFEGTSANGGNVTRNDNGTTDDLTDDRLVYTPAVDFIGTDSFRYSISDGRGTDTGTVTVVVGFDDDVPTSDLSVTASVSNSTPDEGEEITYSIQVSGLSTARDIELRSQLPAGLDRQFTSTSLGVYDPNTNIWRISTLPAGRTATLEINAEVGSGIAGETLVNEVEVISPSGVDNRGTVPITISGDNLDPIATDDEVTTDLGMPVAIDVLANDSDSDGTRLEVTGVGVAENGNASILSNEVIYRPDAEFAGVDSFTYTISDGRGGTDTATVTVTVASDNQDPTAVPDSAIATVGQTISIDVLANDFDPDEEAIGLAAFRRQTREGGTVVRNNNGTARDIRDDFLEYTPAAGFTGTDSFAYRIRDQQGGTDTARVTVNVTPIADFNGSISGTTFADGNSNGIQDAAEQGLTGFTIFLDSNSNGFLDPGEISAVTGASGNYFFGDLPAGSYNVQAIPQSDFISSSSNLVIAVLAQGQNLTGVNFGYLGGSTTVEDILILGSTDDDDLVAGAGNDNLTGDLGNDTLTGGSGSDLFIFNSPDEGVDLITDFDVFASDAIGVSAAGFGAGLIQGNLDPNQFTSGTAATDPNHRFIYGNDGSLFFDADGTGAIGQVQIATLFGQSAEFSASNIIVL